MELIKEFYDRIGIDCCSGNPFMNEILKLNKELYCLISEELNIDIEEINKLTRNIEKLNTPEKEIKSLTGDNYLTKKILKIRLKITIEECELIDDINIAKQKTGS